MMTPTSSKKGEYQFHNPVLKNEDASQIIPKKIGSMPKLAVLLGLLSPTFYEIYNLSDGKKSLQEIGAELGIEIEKLRIYVDKLWKSKMVEVHSA